MNSKHFIYTYLFTLIGGVLLIILHQRQDLFNAIAIILGVCFLVVGVLSLVSSVFVSNKAKQVGMKRSPTAIIVSVASLILGLLMIIVPGFFVKYLVYTFGLLLLLCGMVQLYNFIPGMRAISLSWIFLIVPSLSILAGVLVFVMGADQVLNILALVTGIVLTVYSINGFVGYCSRTTLAANAGYFTDKKRNGSDHASKEYHPGGSNHHASSDVVDVKAEEVKK